MAAWQFLLDENIDPKVATYLEKEGIVTEHVRETLGQGADDEDDVLPYARERGLVIVTSDVTDFGEVPGERHTGIVLLYDDTMPAYRVASALLRMIDAYPSRAEFAGREELDAWA
jgi:predicted nuclease of predicted toxin-antitoxin system